MWQNIGPKHRSPHNHNSIRKFQGNISKLLKDYWALIGIDKKSPVDGTKSNGLVEILAQEHWTAAKVLLVAIDLPLTSRGNQFITPSGCETDVLTLQPETRYTSYRGTIKIISCSKPSCRLDKILLIHLRICYSKT